MRGLILRLANKSRLRHRHVALVFRGGSLVAARANNEVYHAEIKAIQAANFHHKGARYHLISLRVKRDGQFGISCPCSECAEFMKKNGVYKVTYHDGYEFITEKL